MPDFQQRPFFIRVLVPTGDPDGLRIVEKSNRPGVGVVFNRTNYKEAVHRAEFDKTGVYVLIGGSDDSILPTIYVGEGDPVKNRLNQHYGKKDFWDWAAFFVAKDDSLNKAHVQYLEAELLRLARDAKQCRLDNGQGAILPTLSEAELALADSFLQDILSIFPLLGLSVFEKTVTTINMPVNLLTIEAKGIKASGYEDAKGFVVVKGSQLVKTETNTIHEYLSTLRKDLLAQEVILDQGQSFAFAQDQVFTSPSTAAGVVLGRSANGRHRVEERGRQDSQAAPGSGFRIGTIGAQLLVKETAPMILRLAVAHNVTRKPSHQPLQDDRNRLLIQSGSRRQSITA
jgi:hypothetical protein